MTDTQPVLVNGERPYETADSITIPFGMAAKSFLAAPGAYWYSYHQLPLCPKRNPLRCSQETLRSLADFLVQEWPYSKPSDASTGLTDVPNFETRYVSERRQRQAKFNLCVTSLSLQHWSLPTPTMRRPHIRESLPAQGAHHTGGMSMNDWDFLLRGRAPLCRDG